MTRREDEILKKIGDEFKRHTKVLVKEVESRVKLVAKQHGSIIEKLEEHDKRFDKMESELNAVKITVAGINNRLGCVEKNSVLH